MSSGPVLPFNLYGALHAGLSAWVGGPRWKLRLTAMLVALSGLLHFPSFQHIRMHLSGEAPEATWTALMAQRDHPFTQQEHALGSHEEKITFRLTVPLLARLFHVGPWGVYLLQVLLGTALLYLTLLFAERVTGDRVLALLFAAGIMLIFPGSAAFFDTWAHRDPFAFFFLVAALVGRRWYVVGPALFLAAFTDERALVVAPAVLLFHALEARYKGHGATVLAGAVALMAYAAARFALGSYFGLSAGTGGMGIVPMLDRLDPLEWGFWSGLEGAWLLVLALFLCLWAQRAWMSLAAYVIALLVVMGAAAMVTDLTRSMAYGFVLLFPALARCHRTLPTVQLHVLLMAAATVSLLHPMYYTFGHSLLYPVDPLHIKVLRMLRVWLMG